MKKPLDWTKTGTIVAMGSWLRESSGALAVVVIRRDDSALLADPQLTPADAEELVNQYMPHLARDLERARMEKRRGAHRDLMRGYLQAKRERDAQ